MKVVKLEKIRAFVALELPDSLKEEINSISERLRREFDQARIKWVKPENLHFTLKFMAEVEREIALKGLRNFREVVRSIAISPFEVKLERLGVFPNLAVPKVLWIGVDRKAQESMRTLAENLEREYYQLGIPRETREFKAHLTIGRFKGRLPKILVNKLRDLIASEEFNLTFQAKRITLFKSTLTPSGPIYEELDSFYL